MPTPAQLEAKFWKALGSDRTMMLGLYGTEHAHARPMTGLAEKDRSPIWFFTAIDTELVEALGDGEHSGRACDIRLQGPRFVRDAARHASRRH